MDGVHLKVLSLSVDCVLRCSVEMELHSGELLVGSENIASNIRGESLGSLIGFVDGNLCSVTALPDNRDVFNLIGIQLIEIISLCHVVSVVTEFSAEINWALISETTLWEVGSPVSSILFVVIVSITSLGG